MGGQRGSDENEFYDFYGVAVGPADSIYVADTGNNRIQKMRAVNKNDFSGDGIADILWGDYDYTYRMWYMSGNGKIGSHWIGIKDGWDVKAINDFDGDGSADILWRKSNGKYTIWLMDANGKKGFIWIGEKSGWSVENR